MAVSRTCVPTVIGKVPKRRLGGKKMKGFKRGIAAATTAALCLTSIPMNGLCLVSAAEPDRTLKLQPRLASTFHILEPPSMTPMKTVSVNLKDGEHHFAGGPTALATVTQ